MNITDELPVTRNCHSSQNILNNRDKDKPANMKEIAYLLGFGDLSYFSKFFKNYSGSNFKEYKKNTALLPA